MSFSVRVHPQSQRRPLGPRTPTTVHRSASTDQRPPIRSRPYCACCLLHVGAARRRRAARGAATPACDALQYDARRPDVRRDGSCSRPWRVRSKTFWKNESAETRKESQQRRARSCSCPVWRHRSVAEPCRWLALAWALPFAPTAPYVAPCRKRFGVQRCRSLRPSKRLGTAQLAEEDVGHNEVRLIGAAIEHVRQADLLHARDLLFERSAATSRLDHHFVVAHRVTAQVGVETDLRTVR